MVDVDKICQIFKMVVTERPGRIAVYGLGEYAKTLVKAMPDDVFCFCDGKKIDGTFLDKPILTLEALPDEGVQTVFIAAGNVAERIVYDRISPFCNSRGILIYGTQSGNLNIVGQNLSESLIGQEARKRLWECIESHDLISFDIFDTLFMRKTLYPMDVFDIVEYRAGRLGISLLPGFRNYRHQAEVATKRRKLGLAGIYDNLRSMLGISEEDAERLMQIEMEVEKEVIFPRQVMVEAGKFAKSIGKKVVLVSDMYLPTAFMEQLLAENDIDFYDKLYVSDYCGTSKGQKLFEKVKDENPAASYLHIGDNPDVDGWGARRQGIDTFLISSGVDIFRATGLSQPFKYLDGLNERLLVGLFIARAFADPFCLDSQGRCQVNRCADFAQLFVAPLATSFVIWLIQRTQGKNFDGVLFAARDGYLFQKMYDRAIERWQLTDMPDSKYLYASRKLCLGLAARNISDLEWIRSKIQGGTRRFFNDVFRVNIPLQEQEDGESVWQGVLAKQDEIFDKSRQRCRRYKGYIEKHGINIQGNYAFVDMCSQGTSQRALEKVLMPNLYGFYFKRYDSKDIDSMGKTESFLPQDSKIMLLNNVFEFFFTSDEPSANDVSIGGKVIFNEEPRYEAEIKECIESQSFIMDFFDDYISLSILDKHVTRTVGQQLLELYKTSAFSRSINVFRERAISNDLVGGRLHV